MRLQGGARRSFARDLPPGDQSKEEQNHEDYNVASISYLAHRGSHGSFYGQAVRSMILAGKAEVRPHR